MIEVHHSKWELYLINFERYVSLWVLLFTHLVCIVFDLKIKRMFKNKIFMASFAYSNYVLN